MNLYKYAKPHPNMEIAKARKTGAKTIEGKIKVAFNVNQQFKQGSKILALMSKCESCPLKPKEIQVYDPVIKKKILGTQPAKCTFFMSEATEVNGVRGQKCVYPPKQQSELLKATFVTISTKNADEILKTFVAQSQLDAEMSRKVEVLAIGHPGFYTNAHTERGMKAMIELAKLEKTGNSVQISAHGDLASQLIDKLFCANDAKSENPEIKKADAVDVTPKNSNLPNDSEKPV